MIKTLKTNDTKKKHVFFNLFIVTYRKYKESFYTPKHISGKPTIKYIWQIESIHFNK